MQTLSEVALLERAIGYTRGALTTVTDDLLGRPTPCRAWTLGELLHHMADSLEAFTEGSAGLVPLAPAPATTPTSGPVDLLRARACALLGGWTGAPPATWVRIGGDRVLPSSRLLEAASLEIALHGWDVAQATGARTPIPESLARDLVDVAAGVITDGDRPQRFGPVRPPHDATYAGQLLGFSGRRPLPSLPSHPQQGEI